MLYAHYIKNKKIFRNFYSSIWSIYCKRMCYTGTKDIVGIISFPFLYCCYYIYTGKNRRIVLIQKTFFLAKPRASCLRYRSKWNYSSTRHCCHLLLNLLLLPSPQIVRFCIGFSYNVVGQWFSTFFSNVLFGALAYPHLRTIVLRQGWRTCGPQKNFAWPAKHSGVTSKSWTFAFMRDQQSWTNRFHSMTKKLCGPITQQ